MDFQLFLLQTSCSLEFWDRLVPAPFTSPWWRPGLTGPSCSRSLEDWWDFVTDRNCWVDFLMAGSFAKKRIPLDHYATKTRMSRITLVGSAWCFFKMISSGHMVIVIYIHIYITYSAAAIHMGFTGMNHPGTTGRPFDNPAWISHGFFLDVQWLYGTWFPFFFPQRTNPLDKNYPAW